MSTTPGEHLAPPGARRLAARRWAGRALRAGGYVLLAVFSLLVALAATAPVVVSVFGQTVQVGAVPPSTAMGWSGPGEAELFGEGAIQTVQQFQGPIRPRIVWQQFNRDEEASAFIRTTTVDGRRTLTTNETAVGEALARGWIQYFVRLIAMSGVFGALSYMLAVAIGAIARGPRAKVRRARHRYWPIALTSALAMTATTLAAGLTVVSARDQLKGVSTLADLTGTARLVPPPSPAGPARSDIEIAVIGDSTAAGVGNTPITDPSDTDIACQRSRDAYARVLESATGWGVENLACASATIPEGLLGPQERRPVTPAAQVGVLKSTTSLRVVIVSIGANDIGWSDFVKYCYGLPRCDDQASELLVERRLDTFRLQYAQLLQQLSDLPTRPGVIITGYYDPFGDRFDCEDLIDPEAPATAPPGFGFGPDPGTDNQQDKVRQKIDPLRSAMAQLNSVLLQGAEAFGFNTVLPTFSEHGLCSEQPWVQGFGDPYPFHPNAAGELAIAAALLPQLVTLMAP